MPPKKKASEAAAPFAPNPPPLEQTADGADAGGRMGVDEGAHGAARSKDKAALPIGGVAGSHNDQAHSKTSASVHAPRPSQEARDRQRHGTRSTIRLLGQDQAGGSRSAQDQHARQHAGTSEARSPGQDTAPSNIVRSPSISRSLHRSPLPPTTPAEALARAQLLLDYPPTSDKIDEWRATIQSLRLRQRRHSMAAERVAAAAGLPGASRWRRNGWRCNYHAITTPKAKIADSPDPPRQRLHRIVGSTSSSRSAPSSS